MPENIRQKILKILKYFDAYIPKLLGFLCQILSGIKVLILGFSFIFYAQQI